MCILAFLGGWMAMHGQVVAGFTYMAAGSFIDGIRRWIAEQAGRKVWW